MADHPLRPANRRSLGRPLPHLLADSTQADLPTLNGLFPKRCHPGKSFGINYPFGQVSPAGRYITYALLTRLPLAPKGPFDLHVLGAPPALVLSQDRTLHQKLYTLDLTFKPQST